MYLDPSIIEKSIWVEDNPTRITWITLLAMQDYNGNVAASIEDLAAKARLTLDEVRTAIEKFLGPDPKSSTPDYDGRRITKTETGWRLLNREKYKQVEKIEQKANRQVEKRQRNYERVTKHRAAAVAENKAQPEVKPPFTFAPEHESRRLRLCAIYHRKPGSKWTDREQSAFQKFVPNVGDEDFDELIAYYGDKAIAKADDYRRRDLQTLLNNFPSEVDRAKMWNNKSGMVGPMWKRIKQIEEQISRSEANYQSASYNPKCSQLEKDKLSALRSQLKALKEEKPNGEHK